MPTQTEAGKAFEFALLLQAKSLLLAEQPINVIHDIAFTNAERCYNLFSPTEKIPYEKASFAAIDHLIKLEPRLAHPINSTDILTLQIVPDRAGMSGDVRDVLFIRSSDGWEIGVSAKNNHRAVKHSRLSQDINFGREWLGLSCSDNYFNSIIPVFTELRFLKNKNELWRNLSDKANRFYIPVLKSFMNELVELDESFPNVVPQNIVKYLIGNKDFYKVIKKSRKTELYGFNFQGTLNKNALTHKSVFKVPRLKLPTRIIELRFKENSTNTIILTCDEGWQISFRVHNASTMVEPSLKFDINLQGQPPLLYTNHIYWT